MQPRRKRRVVDIESLQPFVVQSIIDAAAQVEPFVNPYPSQIIGELSPTDPASDLRNFTF